MAEEIANRRRMCGGTRDEPDQASPGDIIRRASTSAHQRRGRQLSCAQIVHEALFSIL